MANISDIKLKSAIKEILKGADLDNLSTKKVRKQLEEKFEADLTKRKKDIDALVMQMITERDDEEEGNKASDDETSKEKAQSDEEKSTKEESDDSDLGEIEDVVPKKKAKKSSSSSQAKKKKSASKADDSEDPIMAGLSHLDDEDLAKKLQEEESGLRRRAARRPPPQPKKKKERDPDKPKTSTYSRPCVLSEELAAVVGTSEMARPEIVKTLWSIVKERNLQDPKQKQFMVCDEQLEALFGIKRLKTFSMMKYLKKHIKDANML